MEVLIPIALIGSWALGWVMIKDRLNGRHLLLRHLAGAIGGFVAMMVLGAILAGVGFLKPKDRQVQEDGPTETVPSSEERQATATDPKPRSDQKAPEPKPINVAYTVTEDTLMAPYKRSVEIELGERITEDELRWIAARVMASGKTKVERTFIGYRLKGQPSNTAYWATTHHNPDLEVRIQGLTKEGYEALSSLQVPEALSKDVVGTWIYEDVGLSALNVVYRKNSKLFLARIFPNGEELSNEELAVKNVNGEVRVAEKGNEHGEYFTLDSTGVMHWWGPPLEGVDHKPFNRASPRDVPAAADLAILR
jgi:hypothetical protein